MELICLRCVCTNDDFNVLRDDDIEESEGVESVCLKVSKQLFSKCYNFKTD